MNENSKLVDLFLFPRQPEPITGSTRMKGGTATKILLESVFIYAHNKAFGEDAQL